MRKPRPIRSSRGGPGRGRQKGGGGQAEKLSREERAVAKYLYNHLDSKKATMYGNHKLYFSGAKAVTCLMESKFADVTNKDHVFTSRKMVVEFCQRLLSKDTFHHVLKTVKRQKPRVSSKSTKDESAAATTSKEKKAKEKEEASSVVQKAEDSKTSTGQSSKTKKSSTSGKSKSPDPKESGDTPKEAARSEGTGKKDSAESTLRNRKGKKDEKDIEEKDNNTNEGENEAKDGKGKDSKSEKKTTTTSDQSKEKSPAKKKARGKVLLDLHPNQTFYDDPKEYYVWVFEVTSIWKWLIGGGLIIGSIAICLFPLWPESLRHLAWYATSTVAMGLLGLIFGLALLRLLVYGVVFAATLGKCRYWLFPNLFAEVGFFESFVPVYESKWIDAKDSSKASKKGGGKDKTSDDENGNEEAGQETEESDENAGDRAGNSMDEGEGMEKGENVSDCNYMQDEEENQPYNSSENEEQENDDEDAGEGKEDSTASNSDQEENGFEIVNVEKGQKQM